MREQTLAREAILSILVHGLEGLDIVSRRYSIPKNHLINILEKNNIILSEENLRRLDLAMKYIELGGDAERVSDYLSWSDFEGFVQELLRKYGFDVIRNLRAPPPRGFEIDIIGVDLQRRILLVIDCKHWRRSRESILAEVAENLIERINRLFQRCIYILRISPRLKGEHLVIPMIVTLKEISSRKIGENVLVTPITRFRDLMNNLEYYISELELKPLKRTCI